MRLVSVKEIAPKPSRCIEVDDSSKLFVVKGANGNHVSSHNSVMQRNIIIGCILRPKNWRFIGIDLKRVELSSYRAYSNVVLGIATTLEDAVTCLRFAQETMMKRYKEMEDLGVQNFTELENPGQALMIMIDELGELLSGGSKGKALSELTPILTPNGYVPMKKISIGDVVYDNYGVETTVTYKYEPKDQEQYALTFTSDYGEESIIAGAEHDWVVRYVEDGVESFSHRVTTRELFDKFSSSSARVIVLREGNNTYLPRTVFELHSMDVVEKKHKLYCISVDSPSHQFLCGDSNIPTHNSDAAKEEAELKEEASSIIGSIARLGRAACVFMVCATQRPDATILPGETKANLGMRAQCGNSDSTASGMVLGNAEGTRIRPWPRGRLYLQIHGKGDHAQGFFAPGTWLDEYLKEQGLNPDGTPIKGVSSGVSSDEFTSEASVGYNDSSVDSQDDGDWDFDEEGDDVSGSSIIEPKSFEGQELALGNVEEEDKWHRPEDDWDEDLDMIIEENYNDEEGNE